MPRRTPKNADPSIPHEPSYRLHKPSGQAVTTLSGQDVYCGRFKSPESHERYRTAVGEWIARGRRPAEPEAAPLSVNELILGYIEHAESYYRDRDGGPKEAELWQVRRALKPLRELFGLIPVADFGPRRLEIVRERYVAAGYCRGTVNKPIAIMRFSVCGTAALGCDGFDQREVWPMSRRLSATDATAEGDCPTRSVGLISCCTFGS